MTLPDWKADDYLVAFEDIEFSGNIVDAPLIYKVGQVMKYLFEVIFPDLLKAFHGGGEISGLLLGFSIIEYLAGYYVGRSSNSKDFIAFMKAYFPNQYFPYLDAIYTNLRNGLVHNLTILNPWSPSTVIFIVEPRSDSHLLEKDEKIVFSIFHFIEDIRRAVVMFSYDLVMKPDEKPVIVSNFHKRFNKRDGATSAMVKTH